MRLAPRLRILSMSALFLLATEASILAVGPPQPEGTHALPNIGLSEFLATELGLAGINDHGIDLGGIGSDLFCDNEKDKDGGLVCWVITDRGPNGDGPRTFPVEDFTPFILKVRAKDGVIEILEALPIVGTGPAATGVTGIPNLKNTAEPPAKNENFFGCGGTPELATNPHGIDSEGLVRTRQGEFWVAEEYGPTLLKIDSSGLVERRYFPVSLTSYLAPITGYATAEALPAIYGLKRKLNRGFEGLTISPNQKVLYVALQSPLRNPDNATGDNSRITRILAFDVVQEKVVGEWVYQFQLADEFDIPGVNDAKASDMKISGLAMVDDHRMLVLERTDFMAKIFLADIQHATNVLGSKWDDVATAPSLETLNTDQALADKHIVPMSKEFVLTLDSTVPLHGMAIPQKIEGLQLLDRNTIAIANDNDFGVGSFTGTGEACALVDSGLESKILVIRLDHPL